MLDIVHFAKYYSPEKGGIEKVTESLAVGAAQAGHKTSVVCFSKAGPDTDTSRNGVRLLKCPAAFIFASQPFGWKYFYRAVTRGRRADIVHLHSPNMLAAIAALCLGAKPRVVVHWHSDVVGKGIFGKIARPIELALLHRADTIICTSRHYAEGSSLVRGYLGKVSVVPIGIKDCCAYAAPATAAVLDRRKHKIRGRRVILSVGRLVAYKGFHVLIDAAMHLPDDTVVLIVGTGPLEKSLIEKIQERSLTDKVLLLGRCSDIELDALFRLATLFCLASIDRAEAFGVVLAEAMSYGLPIVSAAIPGSGVPWVNQDGVSGLSFKPNDARDLAITCNRILSSDTLQKSLSDGSRLRYETEFGEDKFIAGVLNLYDCLDSSNRRNAGGQG